MKLHECRGHRIDLSRIQKDSILIDAGMFQGEYTKFLLTHTKNARLFGFEADVGNYTRLYRDYCRKMQVYHRALIGNHKSDKITFFRYGRGIGSIMKKHEDERYNRIKKVKNIDEVKVISINDIFKFLDINHIDHLKMDIEGAEHSVFHSMQQTTADKIKQFSMEYHDLVGCRSKHALFDMLIKLEKLGFRFRLFPESEIYGWRR